MKKRNLLFLMIVALLTSCSKTDELYTNRDYNSPVFDENYYTDYGGLDALNLNTSVSKTVTNPTVYRDFETNVMTYGEKRCLSLEDESFRRGILSKLYDGRTWCNRLYQLSRVQLNKTGFGTIMPKTIKEAEFVAFAARGGTSSTVSLVESYKLNFNFNFNLYTTTSKLEYHLFDIELPTDAGGETAIVVFNVGGENPQDIIGYSLDFECTNLPEGLSDDMNDKEKDHLAIMLYEVMMWKPKDKNKEN